MGIYNKLLEVQKELKAPKGQYNSFGKYKYRSCEDILEAVKPLLEKNNLSMQISDELVVLGGSSEPIKYEEEYYDRDSGEMQTRTIISGGERFYIKSTVTLIDVEDNSTINNTAYAREEEYKKGMDGSQITGTASSYARKYALNGLFLIDDTKDADTDEFQNINEKKATKKQIEILKKYYVGDNLKKLLEKNSINEIEQLSSIKASKLISEIMEKGKKENE